MSGIIARKSVFWAIVLVLALGAFVLLAPSTKAEGPAIIVTAAQHDNGRPTADPPDPNEPEFNPSRNAGNYTVSLTNPSAGVYEATVTTTAPLVTYTGGAGSGRWVPIMIKLPGNFGDAPGYQFRRDNYVTGVMSGWDTLLDGHADGANENGSGNDRGTFLFWISAEQIANGGREIEFRQKTRRSMLRKLCHISGSTGNERNVRVVCERSQLVRIGCGG